MFTGLIESVGTVAGLESTSSGIELRVKTPLSSELRAGDSVSVNGVCLTATQLTGGLMHADIGPETARITTLGSLRVGQPVNLERSMRADSRFGGHFVQGHVDGTAAVARIRDDGDSHWVTVEVPEALGSYIVAKGSIAIDGISLTVAGLRPAELDVMIIPFTWQHTHLPSIRQGDRVNLECDMIGKYVARAMELYAGRLKPVPTYDEDRGGRL